MDVDEEDEDAVIMRRPAKMATSDGSTGGDSDADEGIKRTGGRLRGGGGGATAPPSKKTKKGVKKKADDRLEELAFYGQAATEVNTRAQDRMMVLGVILNPKAHRLLTDLLNDELGIKKNVSKWREHPSARPLGSDWVLNMEQSFKEVWQPDAFRPCPLLQGLPLIENMIFFRVANHENAGNCYWRSVAYHMYGSPEFWPRVKKEHLDHMSTILLNPRHPRNAVYQRINNDFYSVKVSPADQDLGASILLNTYQILKVRGSWTPASMTTITADLYGVYVILFTLQERNRAQPLVTEMRTEGVYVSLPPLAQDPFWGCKVDLTENAL